VLAVTLRGPLVPDADPLEIYYDSNSDFCPAVRGRVLTTLLHRSLDRVCNNCRRFFLYRCP